MGDEPRVLNMERSNTYEHLNWNFFLGGSGRIGPGSGNHWSDGIRYSDWSANGGSQMYRDGLAMGLTDLGGQLYRINGDGSRTVYAENNGRLGYYSNESFTDYWVEDGKLHAGPGVKSVFNEVDQSSDSGSKLRQALDDMGSQPWDWGEEKARWAKLFDGDVLGFWDIGENALVVGGPAGSAASSTIRGITMVLNGSGKGSSAATVTYTVYKAITKNGQVYWVMTKDFTKRAAQHGDRFISITKEYTNIATKNAARGLEQMKIDAAGGVKNLENAINSIGKNNPNLMNYYREAVKYLNGL